MGILNKQLNAGPPANAPVRVLVVDDMPMILEMVSNILRRRGYAVTTATNGKEALDLCLAATLPFDVVVTDLVMPFMTGRELARELKSNNFKGPVVFMSGYLCDEEDKRFGAYVVRKPFRPEDLIDAIECVLSQAQMEAQ